MLKGEVHLRLLLFCPHIDSIVVGVCVVVFLGGERGGGGVELSLLCVHIAFESDMVCVLLFFEGGVRCKCCCCFEGKGQGEWV